MSELSEPDFDAFPDVLDGRSLRAAFKMGTDFLTYGNVQHYYDEVRQVLDRKLVSNLRALAETAYPSQTPFGISEPAWAIEAGVVVGLAFGKYFEDIKYARLESRVSDDLAQLERIIDGGPKGVGLARTLLDRHSEPATAEVMEFFPPEAFSPFTVSYAPMIVSSNNALYRSALSYGCSAVLAEVQS